MARQIWRLIRSGFMSGAENMALDEALLDSLAAGESGPVLRLYRWRPATVTLGYGQRGRANVNLAACRELGYDVVRRCTGGRAVLHDREVTYAVVSPERSGLFPGGILENYKVIADVLQRTVASLGLPATLSAGRSRGLGGKGAQQSACFTAPATHELVFRGCKITGSAQKRRGNAFLQHGSIPVDLDLERLCRALDGGGRTTVAEGARLLGQSVGWLNRWLPEPVTVEAVEERLLKSFVTTLGVELVPGEPSAAESLRAAALLAEKYGNRSWNLAGIDEGLSRAGV